MDLSIILQAANERPFLEALFPRLAAVLQQNRVRFELILVDGGSSDGTREWAAKAGATVVTPKFAGYGGGLLAGFAAASGEYCLTLDADMSHEPEFVAKLWRARHRADIVVASRYVRGGVSHTSLPRKLMSRLLNLISRRALSIPVADLSCAFRLYRREAVKDVELESRNFAVLQEILVKAWARGFSIEEVPFAYLPGAARSNARSIRFAVELMRTTYKLWKLRNSLASADYDERAFYSIIPVQRFWQRRRHRIITSWARGLGRTLDAGCGSSLIIQTLNDAIGMDFSFAKVRFLKRYAIPVLRGSAFALPFKDNTFDCVISSQIIEHIPFDESLFSEMRRLLRPGGTLIIGTPDYATIGWRVIEPLYGMLMPGGYHDEHITHYTCQSLGEVLTRHGFTHEETAYVARSELIMRYRKSEAAARMAA